MQGSLSFGGRVAVRKIKAKGPGLRWQLANYLRWGFLRTLFGVRVVAPIAKLFGVGTFYGTLSAVLTKADGTKIRYGLLDHRVVTNAFVAFVVDQLQTETSVFGDFKYHDAGVGTTDPVAGDTGIETTDGESRATGTQTESSAPVYVSVGTISYTSTKAVTEHGLFNDASAGTLMDRSEFAAVNVVSGDSIQFTYSLTLSSGG
jgi:hypothetical protein